MYYLQLMVDAKDEREANDMLASCRTQVDFRGGRVLPPAQQSGKNTWRLQAFFDDAPDAEWLPAGMRRVNIPAGLYRTLGLA